MQRCKSFGLDDSDHDEQNGVFEQEQEREMSVDVEQELQRSVSRGPHPRPKVHHLHPELISLIRTGIFDPRSPAYMPALFSLLRTSVEGMFDVSRMFSGLYVTADFHRTVELNESDQSILDDYVRPVQFLLSGGSPGRV
jgi:hypothetical protein